MRNMSNVTRGLATGAIIAGVVAIVWLAERSSELPPGPYADHAVAGSRELLTPTSLEQVQLVHMGAMSFTCWLYYPDGNAVLGSDQLPNKTQHEFRVWCK
jgi:hypothetical protein